VRSRQPCRAAHELRVDRETPPRSSRIWQTTSRAWATEGQVGALPSHAHCKLTLAQDVTRLFALPHDDTNSMART
jgi:hypothetical protein